MPTVLSFDYDKDALDGCMASVLGEYVEVATAAGKARELVSVFLRQRFAYLEKDENARLASLDPYGIFRGVKVPETIPRESRIEAFFLNPDYCIGSMIIFQMRHGPLLADLRMTNMRRVFHHDSDDDMLSGEKSMSEQDRKSEKVYYLELNLTAYRDY